MKFEMWGLPRYARHRTRDQMDDRRRTSLALARRVDVACNRFRDDSELSRLNASPAATRGVSATFELALDAALRAARRRPNEPVSIPRSCPRCSPSVTTVTSTNSSRGATPAQRQPFRRSGPAHSPRSRGAHRRPRPPRVSSTSARAPRRWSSTSWPTTSPTRAASWWNSAATSRCAATVPRVPGRSPSATH